MPVDDLSRLEEEAKRVAELTIRLKEERDRARDESESLKVELQNVREKLEFLEVENARLTQENSKNKTALVEVTREKVELAAQIERMKAQIEGMLTRFGVKEL